MKKIKILIIEDEIAIRDMLRYSLSQKEFELLDAEDTPRAKAILAKTIPDLILLDWMLPSESGIDFIRWIKQQEIFLDVPVIMLTAKAEEDNKVRGLLCGADDYVTKPFSPTELQARIKVVLRRGPLISPANEIKMATLTLNVAKHEVQVAGQKLSLSPTEFKLLKFFMRHPGKTYSRDHLISHIWGASVYIDERTVDVQIRRLRDKLKPFGLNQMISTVRGQGYQFNQV